jgi:DHA2 family multidrug resistance protein
MVAPKLMAKVETRYLILVGLILTAGTLYQMTGFTLDTPPKTIVIINIIQGVGLGLLFVPVTSAAFATLPNRLRTSGTAINTLVRNIGSSIGISMVIANLTSKTTYMHERLGEAVTPFNDALQFPDVASILNTQTDTGRAMLDAIVTQQAAVIAYANDFKLLMVLCICAMPLILLVGKAPRTPQAASKAEQTAHLALD